jgi:hypothetical protein
MRCDALYALNKTVILHDVQHSAHLTEYEDARPFGLQGTQQSVQDNHFSTVFDEVLVCGVWRSRFLDEPSALVLERYGCCNVQLLRTGMDGKRPFVIA